MSCRPTEHYDSACQNREIQATYAKKNSATTAAMRKHMNAFLKKGSQNPEKHDQAEKQTEGSAAGSGEMSADTKNGSDHDDSDRDQDLDATV